MPTSQYNFLTKCYLRKGKEIVRFLRILWINFSFFQIKVLSEIVFTRLPSFKIFLTLEKEPNRWKIAKKNYYLYDCLLPWQQSAIHSDERKRNPGCVANLHCECQELKLKVETNSSFLVLHPSLGVDTVNTVGSHLNRSDENLFFFLAILILKQAETKAMRSNKNHEKMYHQT